jgi:hypothetical protein
MVKNLWERDRKSIYRGLLREYQKEGDDTKEARRLASQETEEIMADKKFFVDSLIEIEEEESGEDTAY